MAQNARVAPEADSPWHAATVAPPATVAPGTSAACYTTNKDDDDLKMQSSSKGRSPFAVAKNHVENHSAAVAPRERQAIADRDFELVCDAYEKATGNRWSKSDTETYEETRLGEVPPDKIVSVLEAVSQGSSTKINSFRYSVKEIVAIPDRRNCARHRRQLEKIVRRIRENSVGRAGYSAIDFLEDVKRACAHEGIPFEDDTYNTLG